MTNSFQRVKLGELLLDIKGGGTPSRNNPIFWEGTIPWATVKDMSDDSYFLEDTQEKINELGVEHSATNIIPENTVIISTRMGLGRCFISNKEVAINQDLKALIPDRNKVDTTYLLWLMASLSDHLQSIGTGTTVKGIRLETLRAIDVNVPDIGIQIILGKIINNYEKLIQANKKRIKILEEMAQAVYTEWFVNFRFPGHENVKFVDSELGKIPEDWEVYSIMKSQNLLYIDSNIEKYNGEKIYYDTSSVKGININKKGVPYTYENKPSRAMKKPLVNSIWFARMSNSYKILIFTDTDINFVENSILSSGFIGFKTKYISYYSSLIKSKKFQKLKDSYCTGATQIALTNEGANSIKILEPTNSILDNYEVLVKPLNDLISNLLKKNKSLTETRDMLIPKLISGEIDVSDLDIDVEEDNA